MSQVHLRVRPFTSAEKQDVPPVITITGTDTVVVDPPEGTRSGERQGTYKFSRVHGPETGQVEFYEAVLKPVVTNSMAQGRHGLLFAYGEFLVIMLKYRYIMCECCYKMLRHPGGVYASMLQRRSIVPR